MNRKPSEFEFQVLGLLWDAAPLTVREVLERLPDGKKRAYTSVLSVMQVMEKKGLLTRTRGEGLADQWSPAVRREETVRPVLRRLMDHLFAGRPSAVMQQLLEGGEVTREELARIRRLIDEAERGAPARKGERE
jgi:BlaI family penicillinase repressor